MKPLWIEFIVLWCATTRIRIITLTWIQNWLPQFACYIHLHRINPMHFEIENEENHYAIINSRSRVLLMRSTVYFYYLADASESMVYCIWPVLHSHRNNKLRKLMEALWKWCKISSDKKKLKSVQMSDQRRSVLNTKHHF